VENPVGEIFRFIEPQEHMIASIAAFFSKAIVNVDFFDGRSAASSVGVDDFANAATEDVVDVIHFVRDGASAGFGEDFDQAVAMIPSVFDVIAGGDIRLGEAVAFVVVGVAKDAI